MVYLPGGPAWMVPSELRPLVTAEPLGAVPEDVRLKKQWDMYSISVYQAILHSCQTQTIRAQPVKIKLMLWYNNTQDVADQRTYKIQDWKLLIWHRLTNPTRKLLHRGTPDLMTLGHDQEEWSSLTEILVTRPQIWHSTLNFKCKPWIRS